MIKEYWGCGGRSRGNSGEKLEVSVLRGNVGSLYIVWKRRRFAIGLSPAEPLVGQVEVEHFALVFGDCSEE